MTEAPIICREPEDAYLAVHEMSLSSDPNVARAGRALKTFGIPLSEWLSAEAERPGAQVGDTIVTAVKAIAQCLASATAFNCPPGSEAAMQRALELVFSTEVARTFDAVAAAKQQGENQ